jgi:DNA-binding response OmpR family regulator
MDSKRKKILLVDDSASTVALFTSLLERGGYEVVSALDGPEGIVTAKRERPDLVMLDIEMPTLSGLSVCRILRDDPVFECTPIVLLTSRDDQDMIARGISTGANDYVVKSVRHDELLARIDRLLSTRETFKEQVSEARMIAISQIALSIQHEIFNPLTAVIGFLDMVLREPDLTDRNRKYIDLARTEAARIEKIVGHLTAIEDKPHDRFGVGDMIEIRDGAAAD